MEVSGIHGFTTHILNSGFRSFHLVVPRLYAYLIIFPLSILRLRRTHNTYYIYTYKYIYIYIYTCMYICIYIFYTYIVYVTSHTRSLVYKKFSLTYGSAFILFLLLQIQPGQCSRKITLCTSHIDSSPP